MTEPVVLGKPIRLNADVKALKVAIVWSLPGYFRSGEKRIVWNLNSCKFGLISSLASVNNAAISPSRLP